jgi:hypothetical protein
MEIFGLKLWSKADEDQPELESVTRDTNDGSIVVTRAGGSEAVGDTYSWSTTMDVDPLMVSEGQLITKYREMSYESSIDKAIEIIVNEMVSTSAENAVTINLDQLEYSDQLKDKIVTEFKHVIKLLDFNSSAYDIVRRWYIDGRMQYQVIVDPKTASEVGIGKLVYLDPRKLKKVRLVDAKKDQRTGANLYAEKGSYYLYAEAGFINTTTSADYSINSATITIADDAVVQTTSGLLDPTNSVVLSYLHKAIRPLNQLRGLEDATMIYKLSRAPERRVFYIDVGNLPASKAEAVLQKQMNQYRSKMVYDVATGTTRADPKQMTMIEDYWLPRRSDGRATEITTLPGGNLAGEMGELDWFLKKLYGALNVPMTRLDSQNGFSFGKTTEITRDEVALTKFIYRLRTRFSSIFLDLLKRQLALRGILNNVEFENIRQQISFTFNSDNHFEEMLSLEVFESKMNIIDRIANYVPGGQSITIFPIEFIYKEVLFFDDEAVQELKKNIEVEMKALKKRMDENPENTGVEDQQDGGVSRVIHTSTKNDVQRTPPVKRTISNTDDREESSEDAAATKSPLS